MQDDALSSACWATHAAISRVRNLMPSVCKQCTLRTHHQMRPLSRKRTVPNDRASSCPSPSRRLRPSRYLETTRIWTHSLALQAKHRVLLHHLDPQPRPLLMWPPSLVNGYLHRKCGRRSSRFLTVVGRRGGFLELVPYPPFPHGWAWRRFWLRRASILLYSLQMWRTYAAVPFYLTQMDSTRPRA